MTITIPKAIKHLERKIGQNVFQTDPDALIALKIANEGLKIIREKRSGHFIDIESPLPGETKE